MELVFRGGFEVYIRPPAYDEMIISVPGGNGFMLAFAAIHASISGLECRPRLIGKLFVQPRIEASVDTGPRLEGRIEVPQ